MAAVTETVKRNGLPEFWTTAIAKALAGEQPCLLAPWFSGHYRLAKRPRLDDSALAVWKVKHTALLTETTEKMKAEGWRCSVESYFKVTGQTAVISGKADLICQHPERRPLVIDAKSGSPKGADALQVMIEMIMVPLSWGQPGLIFGGRLVYPTHQVEIAPKDAAEIRPKVFAALKQLADPMRPVASPGESACKFCDVSELDCAERFQAVDAVAETELF